MAVKKTTKRKSTKKSTSRKIAANAGERVFSDELLNSSSAINVPANYYSCPQVQGNGQYCEAMTPSSPSPAPTPKPILLAVLTYRNLKMKQSEVETIREQLAESGIKLIVVKHEGYDENPPSVIFHQIYNQ